MVTISFQVKIKRNRRKKKSDSWRSSALAVKIPAHLVKRRAVVLVVIHIRIVPVLLTR